MGHEHEHEHEHGYAGTHEHEHGHEHGHGHGHGGAAVLYLDCIGGIAGDMLLGALIDIGCGPAIERAVSALALPGVRLETRRVERGGLRALKVDVLCEAPQPSRNHTHIQSLLREAPLDDVTRKLASATFRRLGEAEARAHGCSIDDVHFHEVGAVDAIVDVVGTCAGLASLGARVVSSPLPLGSGTVRAAHGTIPVPGPATLELLRGIPVRGTSHDAELVTPTGAALVTTVASAFGPLPPMRPRSDGYGAGTRELPDLPNVVRAVLGDEIASDTDEALLLLEANVDDMTPEVAAHAAEQTRRAGALDVWLVPILMKKGRPGIEIRALCRAADRDVVARTILSETTTLGLRIGRVDRLTCERRTVEVETPWGRVPIKVGSFGGADTNAAPELEACRAVAERARVPLKQVLAEAMAAYLRR